ncbi:hypothetical protein C8R43DRAFT_959276 [Mycena crocata]|nr:hypothetical protein C8R43DRAFT_959276 [Mycena crocata]
MSLCSLLRTSRASHGSKHRSGRGRGYRSVDDGSAWHRELEVRMCGNMCGERVSVSRMPAFVLFKIASMSAFFLGFPAAAEALGGGGKGSGPTPTSTRRFPARQLPQEASRKLEDTSWAILRPREKNRQNEAYFRLPWRMGSLGPTGAVESGFKGNDFKAPFRYPQAPLRLALNMEYEFKNKVKLEAPNGRKNAGSQIVAQRFRK